MATATTELIDALRIAADRLKSGAVYAWGNHGACNCGHILQVVGSLSREEILRAAHSGVGEWTELAEEYCGVTNAPVDLLIGKLQQIGLTPSDIHHLEYLNNRTVLERLPGGFRWLQKNSREDVILYFETFAAILEDEWLSSIHLPALFEKEMASV
jgi:hypothetical protein